MFPSSSRDGPLSCPSDPGLVGSPLISLTSNSREIAIFKVVRRKSVTNPFISSEEFLKSSTTAAYWQRVPRSRRAARFRLQAKNDCQLEAGAYTYQRVQRTQRHRNRL